MLAQITGGELEDIENDIGLRFAGGTLGDIVTLLVKYLFPIAGLLLILYLLYGGYQFMLSRGDPKAIEKAKGIITTAIIGFIIVFVAFWIVQIVGIILGLETITEVFQ